MKKSIIILTAVLCLNTSCATLFTGSKQDITFTGISGTKIYDSKTNVKLGEINESNTATIAIKKKREDKILIAKKEGYASLPINLESVFNKTSLWNILFWPGFIVDLATEQINKYDTNIVNIELEKQ